MIAGLLLLAVFVVFAGLMYTRTMPALLAVPLMAVVMALVVGVRADGLATIVLDGSRSLAPVYVTVIFGAMLGRVTLDTGIARSIVNFAAEFAGEQPAIVALLLSLVVALLFVSLSGLGAIIMVGSIVLPIMMTTGVPRRVAAPLFLMAFALGFIFNIANWKFYTQFFGVTQPQMTGYATVLALVDLVALAAFTVIAFARQRGYAAWAVRADDGPPRERVPALALVTPVLPIALYFFVHLDAMIAFILSAFYGALVTRPRAVVQTLVSAAIRGVEDVAPAVVLFIGIGMLLTATKAPQFSAALAPLVSANLLRNPFAYVVLFGLLSPLVLYRGPLNPFGVGIAIFTVLLNAHVLPPVVLVAAIMAVVQVQNVCDPTNTANVWVANFTGVPIDEITKRTLPFQVAVATIACIAVVAASAQFFGTQPFVFAQAARADELPSPLFAPPSAANRIAVGDDGTALGRAGAAAIVARVNADWPGMTAFAASGDPNAQPCAGKTYAAFVAVTATPFALVEGTDLDVGVALDDCGGWEVSQWHDHAVVSGAPQSPDAVRLALDGLARMRAWASGDPVRAQHLFSRGLAYAPGDPPTYYFTLFKTVDGQMRAYVRAGGPAYAAGLRTNDVVDKLDGKFWWEYGTYQTQLRAYDGKAHAFAVERGAQNLQIQFGQPFVSTGSTGV